MLVQTRRVFAETVTYNKFSGWSWVINSYLGVTYTSGKSLGPMKQLLHSHSHEQVSKEL